MHLELLFFAVCSKEAITFTDKEEMLLHQAEELPTLDELEESLMVDTTGEVQLQVKG
jgi:hypothetical protein